MGKACSAVSVAFCSHTQQRFLPAPAKQGSQMLQVLSSKSNRIHPVLLDLGHGTTLRTSATASSDSLAWSTAKPIVVRLPDLKSSDERRSTCQSCNHQASLLEHSAKKSLTFPIVFRSCTWPSSAAVLLVWGHGGFPKRPGRLGRRGQLGHDMVASSAAHAGLRPHSIDDSVTFLVLVRDTELRSEVAGQEGRGGVAGVAGFAEVGDDDGGLFHAAEALWPEGHQRGEGR